MKRTLLLLAAGLLSGSALARQEAPPSLRTARTPAVPNERGGIDAGASRPRSRLSGQVFLPDRDMPLEGGYTLTLLGEGLRGESGDPLDLDVEGGTGRFEWSIVAPGHDPARGVVALRDGETATIGVVRLLRGRAVLEGL
ncbi:MAG: hypothetical protein ACREIU_01120, partial [Planctomycetota bacterium]